jgi:hypothetical protein
LSRGGGNASFRSRSGNGLASPSAFRRVHDEDRAGLLNAAYRTMAHMWLLRLRRKQQSSYRPPLGSAPHETFEHEFEFERLVSTQRLRKYHGLLTGIWSPTRSPCRGCQCTGGGGGASRRLGGPSHEARPTRAGRRVPAHRPGHGQVLGPRPGPGWKPCPNLKQHPTPLKFKLLRSGPSQVSLCLGRNPGP